MISFVIDSNFYILLFTDDTILYIIVDTPAQATLCFVLCLSHIPVKVLHFLLELDSHVKKLISPLFSTISTLLLCVYCIV